MARPRAAYSDAALCISPRSIADKITFVRRTPTQISLPLAVRRRRRRRRVRCKVASVAHAAASLFSLPAVRRVISRTRKSHKWERNRALERPSLHGQCLRGGSIVRGCGWDRIESARAIDRACRSRNDHRRGKSRPTYDRLNTKLTFI